MAKKLVMRSCRGAAGPGFRVCSLGKDGFCTACGKKLGKPATDAEWRRIESIRETLGPKGCNPCPKRGKDASLGVSLWSAKCNTRVLPSIP